jgi:hypothetical protein
LDRRDQEDFRGRRVELADGLGLTWPIEPKSQPAGGEILGKSRCRTINGVRTIGIPLGEAKVAVSRLQESQLRHGVLAPSEAGDRIIPQIKSKSPTSRPDDLIITIEPARNQT